MSINQWERYLKSLQEEICNILRESGVIITDKHFVYTPKEVLPGSGNWEWFHGSDYVAKEGALMCPLITQVIGLYLAGKFLDQGIDIVIGPETGAIILAYEVARQLAEYNSTVKNLYAEKQDRNQAGSPMVIRRGFDKMIPGKRVLVVEDVLTSGGSARRVVEAVRALGGEVIGVGAICNRGDVKPEAVGNVPIVSVVELEMSMYPEEECPLCKAGVPINTDFGRGKEWLARNQNKK